jgi:hypothetical protein
MMRWKELMMRNTKMMKRKKTMKRVFPKISKMKRTS